MPFARLPWTILVLYGVTLCYKKDGKCYKSMDLLIALDVSGSIDPESWRSEINISKEIIQSVAVPQSGNNFAIMDFSTEPNIIFNLDSNEKNALVALDELKSNFKDGHSFIDLALHRASSILSSAKSKNPLKILIIITDGYMTLKDGKEDTYFLSPAKKKLSDANVTVFAVGIGKVINEEALKLISSSQSHVFNVSDGRTLLQQIQKSAEMPCSVDNDSPGQANMDATLKCDKIHFKRVGCYRDGQVKPRPLPQLILTDRDQTSKVYSGQTINWKKWDTYLPNLVCRCAEESAKKGMVMFGLQYYGECWASTKEDTFNRDGPAKSNSSCVTLGYKPCGEGAKYCVGEAEHNYVYIISR